MSLLDSFKEASREEGIIAEHLLHVLGEGNFRTLLDVGAGRGEIGRVLRNKLDLEWAVAVDPDFRSLDGYDKVIRGNIENVAVNDTYDLIVLSHVLGHVPPKLRSSIVARLLDRVSKSGVMVVVTNALVGRFAVHQETVWDRSGNENYRIDVRDLVRDLEPGVSVFTFRFTLDFSHSSDETDFSPLFTAGLLEQVEPTGNRNFLINKHVKIPQLMVVYVHECASVILSSIRRRFPTIMNSRDTYSSHQCIWDRAIDLDKLSEKV